MKIKEIMEISSEELEKKLTNEQFDRIMDLGFNYVGDFLEDLQKAVKLYMETENTTSDEEYVEIDEYLDFIEENNKFLEELEEEEQE